MLVRKGTFIFSCKEKGGIPMILDRCKDCKIECQCSLYHEMKKMEYDIEHDTRQEIRSSMFRRELLGI